MPAHFISAIAAALTEITERPVETVNETMRLDKDFDLDSYMFVQFLLTLEEKVPGLHFDPEAITQDGFNTVQTLLDYISERVVGAGQVEHA